VRSLARAFTRAIPPACQADTIWRSLPAGSAGTARVVLEIDAEGRVTGWKPDGERVAPHFEGLVKRTLVLLRSGTFAIQGGAVTAGAQTLEINAEVKDVAADVEEGAAVDLAWRFEGSRGTASFTQAGGRRVEIAVRVVRAVLRDAEPPG
jgi:hypothetical protein